jgi:hypothetical protein
MARFSIRAAASASAATPEGDSSKQLTPVEAKKEERRKQIKKEGGRFAFNTKYGDWDLWDDYLTYFAANNTETTPSIL